MSLSLAWFAIRAKLRRRLAALVGLALLVAIGLGVMIGSLVAAHQTDRAYPEYVDDAAVSELVVNPGLSTQAMADAIREFPGVRSVHSSVIFLATVSSTESVMSADGSAIDENLQVYGSVEGRFAVVDRPVVTDGRLPTGSKEVFVAEDYRDDLEDAVGRHVDLGDIVEVAFWWGAWDELGQLPPGQVLKPIGVERLHVSGFGRLPDEVLPDELYPRQRMIVSPDVARRYTCRADLSSDMDAEQTYAAVFPARCSRQLEFFALELDGSRNAVVAVQRAFNAAADRLADDLPQAVFDVEPVPYFYLSQDRAAVDADIHQITRPTVATLVVLAMGAGLATLAVAAVAVSRILSRDDAALRSVRALGATTWQRTLLAVSPLVLAGLVGVLCCMPVALAVSLAGPAGSVRAVAPSAGVSLPVTVVLPIVAVFTVTLVIVIVTVGWTAARRAAPFSPRPRRPWRHVWFGRRPAALQGLRAALPARRRDGAVTVLAGCVVGITAIVAAIVFASNLGVLVDSPARYGWPWDVAVITGFGYGDTKTAAVEQTLAGRDDVVDYTYFAFDPGAPINGRPVPVIFGLPGAERTSFTLIEGRQPRRPGEVVLGSATATELGIEVGERVRIRALAGLQRADVVGIGVLPALGSFIADRTGLGTGAFMVVESDHSDRDVQYPAAMTAIDLDAGTSAHEFVADVNASLPSWDALDRRPLVLTSAVRPFEIVNAGSMRTLPLALGALLAVGLTIGLGLAIGVSVRDRRRELAILRSLGFRSRDLWATVSWQALAVVAVGLIVGVPLGIAAGGLVWSMFADELGVVTDSQVPIAAMFLVAASAIACGLVAALPAARTASTVAPGVVLSVG